MRRAASEVVAHLDAGYRVGLATDRERFEPAEGGTSTARACSRYLARVAPTATRRRVSRREFRVALDAPRPAAAFVMGAAATATLAITGQISPAALAAAALAVGGSPRSGASGRSRCQRSGTALDF